MILIEDAREIPDILLTDISKFERLAVPEDYWRPLVNQSWPAKIFLEDDRTLLVAGVYSPSLVGVRHFWALISPELAGAKPSSLRALRQYGDEVLPGTETYIVKAEDSAIRLAHFFGFQPTAKQLGFGDKIYEVYRRPA